MFKKKLGMKRQKFVCKITQKSRNERKECAELRQVSGDSPLRCKQAQRVIEFQERNSLRTVNK